MISIFTNSHNNLIDVIGEDNLQFVCRNKLERKKNDKVSWLGFSSNS